MRRQNIDERALMLKQVMLQKASKIESISILHYSESQKLLNAPRLLFALIRIYSQRFAQIWGYSQLFAFLQIANKIANIRNFLTYYFRSGL